MILPHWVNTVLCDKSFIVQGVPAGLREAGKQQKKIGYIAVYGRSKLEYKAPVCLCRFHLAKALSDEEKSQENKKDSNKLHIHPGA